MNKEKLLQHKQISEQLKAKSYESEMALSIEILTSGMHPKAIIILSFFLLLKANRMPFNKYELAKRLRLSEYSSQKYSKLLVELGLLKRDLEYSKAGNTAYYSIFEFDIKSQDKQKTPVILPSQAIENHTEKPTSSFSYENEKRPIYSCEKSSESIVKNVLNKIKNSNLNAHAIDIEEEVPNAGGLGDDMKFLETADAPVVVDSEVLQKNDMKQKPRVKKEDACIEVIDYLNLKARKHFKNTPANCKFINARLKDGYTISDLKNVIDLKTKDWLEDDKMNMYLRPETLFNSTKFETYHQKASETKPKEGVVDSSYLKFRLENLKEFYQGFDYVFVKDGTEYKGNLNYISLEGDTLVLEFKDLEDYDNIILVSYDNGILLNDERLNKLKDFFTKNKINKR